MADAQLPHKLTLSERKELAISGVTDVASFDDTAVVLHTACGTLTVHGSDLQLRQLSLDGGQVAVQGTVSALTYEEPRQSGGVWRRLFG